MSRYLNTIVFIRCESLESCFHIKTLGLTKTPEAIKIFWINESSVRALFQAPPTALLFSFTFPVSQLLLAVITVE